MDQQTREQAFMNASPARVGGGTTGTARSSSDATTTQLTATAPPTTARPTTTAAPLILGGSQPASISAATVGTLLPVLGVLYLLRGLLPQAGGKYTRRRHTNHRGRRG